MSMSGLSTANRWNMVAASSMNEGVSVIRRDNSGAVGFRGIITIGTAHNIGPPMRRSSLTNSPPAACHDLSFEVLPPRGALKDRRLKPGV